LKELDLSWCQGFTNTGLLAFATYLNNAQYNHRNYYRNVDYDNYIYNDSHHHNHDNHNDGNDDNILSSFNEKSNSTTTSVTSVGVEVAHQQAPSCCLEKLGIEWCSQITSNEAMNMISNILSLKSIHITGCCGITEEGLMCFKRNGINIC
jgi:hypothetical protein